MWLCGDSNLRRAAFETEERPMRGQPNPSSRTHRKIEAKRVTVVRRTMTEMTTRMKTAAQRGEMRPRRVMVPRRSQQVRNLFVVPRALMAACKKMCD